MKIMVVLDFSSDAMRRDEKALDEHVSPQRHPVDESKMKIMAVLPSEVGFSRPKRGLDGHASHAPVARFYEKYRGQFAAHAAAMCQADFQYFNIQ